MCGGEVGYGYRPGPGEPSAQRMKRIKKRGREGVGGAPFCWWGAAVTVHLPARGSLALLLGKWEDFTGSRKHCPEVQVSERA